MTYPRQLLNGHGKLVCKHCRVVIVQCRCFNHNVEHDGECDACKGKLERPPAEKFALYVRGWKHGSVGTMASYTTVHEYMRGYEEARVAKNAAVKKYCDEIGYDIMQGVLR